jgi:hypothetical protein
MENSNRSVRSAIYPKDIANITGKSVKSATKLFHKIKEALGKDRHQILTVNEFCEFMNLKFNDIQKSLNL